VKKIVYWKGLNAIFGLMFKIPKENTLYVLDIGKRKKANIHTFFCLKNLDIFLLDEKLNIVEFYKNVKPFRIIFPKKEFRYIVEGVSVSFEDIEYIRNNFKI